MNKLPSMIDMARTSKDSADAGTPVPIGMLHDRYPAGLCLSLDHVDLEKLGLDSDCKPGDLLQGSILGKVTSVSKRDGRSGEECRIELQVTHMSVGGEAAGYDPMEKAERDIKRKLYDSPDETAHRPPSSDHARKHPQADT